MNFTLKRIQDVKHILNRAGVNLDPSKTRVYVGRIENAREDLYNAILIINDIIKYEQKNKSWWQRFILKSFFYFGRLYLL